MDGIEELKMVRRLVARGIRHIERQREIAAQLTRDGHDCN